MHSYYITIFYLSYHLFHDAVNRVDYTVICDRMTGEYWIGKDMERSSCSHIYFTILTHGWNTEDMETKKKYRVNGQKESCVQ